MQEAPSENELAEIRRRLEAASKPACCKDLPDLGAIKAPFTLQLREPVPIGEGVPPCQQLVFKGLRFSDLDALPTGTELSFGHHRQLVQRSTSAAPTVIDALGLEDAQRAMYVVSGFLRPLRQ